MNDPIAQPKNHILSLLEEIYEIGYEAGYEAARTEYEREPLEDDRY